MSINIPAETPDESTNPISVEEFELLPDGACTLASITAGELETFDYQLHNETGGTR